MSSVVALEGETSFRSRSDTIPTSFPLSFTIGIRRMRFSFMRWMATEIESVGWSVATFGDIHFETRMANLRRHVIQPGMPARSDDSPESGAGPCGALELEAGAPGAEPERRLDLLGGNGPAEQEALDIRAAESAEQGGLLLRLDALGRHVEAEVARHRNDRRDDGLVFFVVGHPGHEGLVDLQASDGKVLEVVQRGVAGSEVVHRNLDTEFRQLGEH